MADSEHSSSNETSVDFRVDNDMVLFVSDESSKENKQEFTEDEETLIIRMYNLVGERWSLIAGRIPGRTAEEIEKYWNSRCSTSE
ncbi:hypothetical protein RHSIM_Rhsim02G0111800 [Rhododendron simsii]|uniref:MYB-like transcription factor ETC1 n=1 Tax=Rhododendron simsii TaxID=118357 RepID=A0A834HEU1_RHOSS|nr:hypothetical protein RHSIM_Rhsim02G0111800 [Rhododendron simsii]